MNTYFVFVLLKQELFAYEAQNKYKRAKDGTKKN